MVALEAGIEPAAFRGWLAAHHITVLNVAGPRESQRPGVYAVAVHHLKRLWPTPRAAAPRVYTSCTLPDSRAAVITEPSEVRR